MSVIALLVKWTGLPAWVMELLVIGLVVSGVLWWEHREINKGVHEQQQADQLALEQLQAKADAQSATLLKRAQAAESAYAQEHLANLTPPPITGPLLVCDDSHSGLSHLPEASTAHSGDAATPALTPMGSPVHPGDPPVAADRLRLLAAFGALLDDQSAVIREYQSR